MPRKIKKIVIFSLLITWAILNAIIVFDFIERKVLYPLKYTEEILYYSKEYSLSPFLVFSVINTESSFKVDAESTKGAKGLMQLTDKTAGYIADMLNENSFDIFDKDTNIKFGCFYLRYLLNKFKNERTALIAYNAGEGNVVNWLKNPSYSIDGKSLLVIPFKETNSYVKKIYHSLEKYRKLYRNILDKP